MNSKNSAFGSSIAAELRIPGGSFAPASSSFQTVAQLLDLVAGKCQDQPVAMLRTAAGWFAKYVGVSIEDLKIDLLDQALPGFKPFLRARPFEPTTAKSYRDFVVRLLRLARELGWVPTPSHARTEWEKLLTEFQMPTGCSGMVNYAIAKGKAPGQLTDSLLAEWAKQAVEHGSDHTYVHTRIRNLSLAILSAKAEEKFPLVSTASRVPRLAVPIDQIPDPLRAEIRALMHWKEDPYVPGRPPKQRHSPPTAKMLKNCLARLYGFVLKNPDLGSVVHLADLLKQEILGAYISWAINEEGQKETSFRSFQLLSAAVRQYPEFKSQDFRWLRELLAAIPKEPESEKRARKALKYLPYDDLNEIPKKMARARQRLQKGTKGWASMVHDELMMRWLLAMPWRQRNLREGRLDTSDRPNIFKAGFSPLLNIARPPWVEEELKRNPNAQFWQVFFRESETKMHREVRGVIPQEVIPLLEEYLLNCRPLLVGDQDPHTLFLQRSGRALTQSGVSDKIGQLTAKYGGRRVTPHLFRDSYAHKYLIENPLDYLTLSKMLWHSSLAVTVKIYGSNFDESHGMCSADAWLKRRKQRIG